MAPADGTITAIEDFDSDPHYDGPCRRVSIFLSVLSVHATKVFNTFEGGAIVCPDIKTKTRIDQLKKAFDDTLASLAAR